jgi:hypothetical protein
MITFFPKAELSRIGLLLKKKKKACFSLNNPPKKFKKYWWQLWEMICLILQGLRNETCNISLEIFVLDDIMQTPSQGWVCFVILGWYGLLFKLLTNSKRRSGHSGKNKIFFFFLRKIILTEALFAKILLKFFQIYICKKHISHWYT